MNDPNNLFLDPERRETIHSHIMQQFTEQHNEILKQVIKQIVKREPTIDDAKRLCRYVKQGELDYDLAWDGVLIGRVSFGQMFNITEPFKYTITFTPCEMFK